MSCYRMFRTRTFARWMRKAGVAESALFLATAEMALGLVDADLGGHLVKKRVPLPGHGKRSGGRTIVATNLFDRWFFLYGFEKNDRDTIEQRELKAFQEVAGALLALADHELVAAIAAGEIEELFDGKA